MSLTCATLSDYFLLWLHHLSVAGPEALHSVLNCFSPLPLSASLFQFLLLSELHPTPAVSGHPQREALRAIAAQGKPLHTAHAL